MAGVRWAAASGARPLRPEDLGAAYALCARDPVAAVLASVRLDESGVRSYAGAGAWGTFEHGELQALAWVGPNIVPVSPSGRGLDQIAGAVIEQGRRFASLVGDATAVHAVWNRLALAWPEPRQVREQPSLALATPPRIPGDVRVRPARPDEIDVMLPASVAMFTEEYGYSPLSAGGGYAARVRQLLEAGRSFVVMEGEGPTARVLFKAEIGAMSLGVAQIQGVWVAPDARGRGLGAAGTAAVVERARELGARTVSLYVNDYNTAARRTYRRVGFDQVGGYTTIVL
ncbi:GNAT family N-acetyltransferase [Miniimonas arenae]|uniref:GNAT family N-acetyltransferase n=1 Tax=Miniimonas arenae TaxID=676201 RepID=A0A5C5BGX6_9MICO|nr:GNAT family N-acetyltransferase [Miniimonas arenae]